MAQRNNEPQEDPGYIPDEDDPDYELSEAAGYSNWEPPKRNWVRPLVLVFTVLMLIAMLAPLVLSLLGPI